jgi:hypothetical protein
LIAASFEVGDVVGDGVDAFCFHGVNSQLSKSAS